MDHIARQKAGGGRASDWIPAAGDHVLHVYDDEATLLDLLERFTVEGLRAGEAVLVIATAPHREALRARLEALVDVDAAIEAGQLTFLSAQETLERFIVRGEPDEALFHAVLDEPVRRARAGGRVVRAFGEMVALLWLRGNQPAAVRLECLWNRYLADGRLTLLCAYPRFAFTEELVLATDAVCRAHNRIIA